MYRKLLVVMAIVVSIMYLVMPRNKYPVQELSTFSEFSMQSIASPETLVLFDVDEVIISSLETSQFSLLFRARLLWNFPQFFNHDTWECAHSWLWKNAQFSLIEPGVVPLIQQLKQQGCFVLGLTSMESGAYGVIPDMPMWRYEMLRGMGVAFTQEFGNYTFTRLPAYRDHYPVLYKGILCANQQSKGAVLQAFLEQFALRPQKLIFFDDSLDNLQSVGKVCEALGIPVALYHYKGAADVLKNWHGDHVLDCFRKAIEACVVR